MRKLKNLPGEWTGSFPLAIATLYSKIRIFIKLKVIKHSKRQESAGILE